MFLLDIILILDIIIVGKEALLMIPLGPIFQAVGAVVDLIIEAVENFSDSWGGEKVNAGKVILGALTIIGLLADIIDDD